MRTTASEARAMADLDNNVSTLDELYMLIYAASSVGNYSVIIHNTALSQDLEQLIEDGFSIHRVDEWRLRVTW